MKHLGSVVLVLFCASFTFAASTDTYVVALKRSAVDVPRLMMEVEPSRQREVTEFRTLNAFAVELTEDEAAELRLSRDVRYVEQVAERHALGLTPAAAATSRNLLGQTLPFGIEMVHAPEVWSATRGDAINVVVVDTGVDYKHPDLAPVYRGGYNVLTKKDDALDDNGHGTHVAGTIAAADNDFGVVGVAPNVRLWAVKALKADGKGSTGSIVAAMDWIIKQKRANGGNWVVNLSLGSAEPNTAEQEAFARAVDEGLLVFAASGNESEPDMPAPVGYPASYPGVMAIGAVNDNRTIAGFSNQGPELTLVAPGVGVLSTLRVGSGSLALVRTENSAFTAGELTGSPKGTVTGNFVNCGLGKAGEFPAAVAGKIALIKRGEIAFGEKARNATTAGAAAVIIFNHDDSALNWTLVSESDPSTSTFAWPLTVALSKEAGEALLRDTSATITISLGSDDYGALNGTSMATPHAAGVGALVWSLSPAAPASAVRSAMTQTASDLGLGGPDPIFGYGMVDALTAARNLAPTAFAPEVPNGRRVLRRGR